MDEAIIIFPTQLFERHPGLSKERAVILVEHPRYFTDFAFHKQKLILHRASMKRYEQFLKKKKYKVVYLDHKDDLFSYLKKKKIETIHSADVVDSTLEKELTKEAKKAKITLKWYQTPAFLTPVEWMEKKYGDKKEFFAHTFYVAQRKRMKVLLTKQGKPVGGSWTYDKENRESLSEAVKIPELPTIKENEFVKEAKKYIEKHFKKNPGQTEKWMYPTDHGAAKKWLKNFLRKRLKKFGPYQDAIAKNEPFLFHSLLSPLLNIGLLTPEYVLQETLEYAKEHSIPINSLEGFVRQLIGWREFVRMVYLFVGQKQRKSNYFRNRKKLPNAFYTAKTDIEPIDTVISQTTEFAYAHHIQRLMILGNFMLLCGIKPDDIYRWFMELFIDAYDWVMVPNVYGMSQYADGGLMTTKPYISSSNYILKMSNYAENDWSEMWDALFWAFIAKHAKKFAKNNRMGLIMHTYKKKSKKAIDAHIKTAKKFLRQL